MPLILLVVITSKRQLPIMSYLNNKRNINMEKRFNESTPEVKLPPTSTQWNHSVDSSLNACKASLSKCPTYKLAVSVDNGKFTAAPCLSVIFSIKVEEFWP